MSVNSKIAELILRTQNASDGGKNIFVMDSKKAIRDNCGGYATKDKLLLLAIEMIARNKGKCKWKYAVVEANDQNGYNSIIVYFQTQIEGEKVQISFHSFNFDLRRFATNSFRIKWDRGDSRDSAIYAYKHFCNGNYIY